MPLPRLTTAVAASGLVALALAAGASSREQAMPALRSVIVAARGEAGTATDPDGSWRTELQWLLPGDADPVVSPDGRRVAFSGNRTGSSEIYVADAATGEVRRLTARPRVDDTNPAWSPDGRRIVWQSGRAGDDDLFVMRADGTRKRLLVGGAGDDVDPAWSPDGRRIVFASISDDLSTVLVVPAAGGVPAPMFEFPGSARSPAWSPDGRQLAFSGSADGLIAVWAVDLDTLELRRVTRSRAVADLWPDWSPDGAQLAFTRSVRGRTRTWIVGAASAAPARPLPGTEGDLEPDWAQATQSLAPGPEQQLPDLDQRAPTGLRVMVKGHRFVLGFTSAVENLGDGPLRIRGWRPPGHATMRADQVVELQGGGTLLVRGVGRLRYEDKPPHHHWHFQPFETYELRRASDHALVGRDRKSGFCLVDRYGRASHSPHAAGPPRFLGDCGSYDRTLRRVDEGSSPGYVDRYPAFFHGQDIDLTGLAAGVYEVVHRANPVRMVRELVYSNDTASVRVRLTWPAGRKAPPRVTVLRHCEASERCPAGA
jgi:WD40 repeat protein/lysyl oxidase